MLIDDRILRKGVMRNHMLTHAGKKPYLCLECVNRFTHAGDVKKHMLAHTADKQHACPECGKRFIHKGVMVKLK